MRIDKSDAEQMVLHAFQGSRDRLTYGDLARRTNMSMGDVCGAVARCVGDGRLFSDGFVIDPAAHRTPQPLFSRTQGEQ